jgi:23S rRNA (pseudouridine1915-N3)-methyltransferase
MKINIYTIEKKSSDDFSKIIQKQKKMIQKYAQVEEISIFNKKISQAQNRDDIMAKESYSEAFLPYLKGYNIALHPAGKELDSFEFSQKFDINTTLNFFIAGAYGFEESFLKKVDSVVSLSRLTYSHKIAKVVLFEQIYRALSIKNNHPYHK